MCVHKRGIVGISYVVSICVFFLGCPQGSVQPLLEWLEQNREENPCECGLAMMETKAAENLKVWAFS